MTRERFGPGALDLDAQEQRRSHRESSRVEAPGPRTARTAPDPESSTERSDPPTHRPPDRNLGLLSDDLGSRDSGVDLGHRGSSLERDADRFSDAVTDGHSAARPARPIGSGGGAPPPHLTDAVNGIAALGGGSSHGRPLPAPIRRRLEAASGTSLAGVQVHANHVGRSALRRLGASAATFGDDIVVADPAAANDVSLLAHEVAHTIQQRSGPAFVQRRDENEPTDGKRRGLSNKYEVNIELAKAGKHSGSVRFSFKTRAGGVLEDKVETEGGGGSAKVKLFDNKVSYKRAAGKGGHQIAAALATAEIGAELPGALSWITVSLEGKALEGQIAFSGDDKLSLLKVGVKLTGTAPESFLAAAGLPKELAGLVTLTIEGKYEYAIPPEDLGKLYRMYQAGKDRLANLEKAAVAEDKLRHLEAEKKADTRGQRAAGRRDRLQAKLDDQIRVKRKADAAFDLDGKKQRIDGLRAERDRIEQLRQDARKKLHDKRSSPRKNKPKRTVSPQNRAAAKQRVKGLKGNLDGLDRQIRELERDVRRHERKHPAPKESRRLKKLKTRLTHFDARNESISKVRAKFEKHKKLVKQADDVIAKTAGQFKSRAGQVAGKVMGQQLKKATGKLIIRLGAKLIPGLNVISIAVDVYELSLLAYDLLTGRAKFGLGGGDRDNASKDGVEGGQEQTGTDTATDVDPGDTGTSSGGADASGSTDTGTTGEEGEGASDTGAAATGADAGVPEAGAAAAGVSDTGTEQSDPDGPAIEDAAPSLHPRTQAIIDAAGGEGLALDASALRSLDAATPKDISDAEFQVLLDTIRDKQAKSADELIGRLVIATTPEPARPPVPEEDRADDTVSIELGSTEEEKPESPPEVEQDAKPQAAEDVATPEAAPEQNVKREAVPEQDAKPEAAEEERTPDSPPEAAQEATPDSPPVEQQEPKQAGRGDSAEQEVDDGDVEGGEQAPSGEGERLVPRERALKLLAPNPAGKGAPIVRNEDAITAFKAETVTASDGTTFSVRTVVIDVGQPVDGIRTLDFQFHLTKTGDGTAERFAGRDSVLEILELRYDEEASLGRRLRIIPTVDYSPFFNALASTLAVDGEEVTLKASAERRLGGVVTAKLVRVVEAKRIGPSKFAVEVEIIPTKLVEGMYGPIVNGQLRRFVLGRALGVPFELVLTRQ